MTMPRWLLAALPLLARALAPPVLKARLEAQETRIRELKKRCEDVLPNEDEAALLLDGYYPALDLDQSLDHWLLRFVDGVRDGIDLADAERTLRDSLAWRRGVGRDVARFVYGLLGLLEHDSTNPSPPREAVA